MKVILHPIGVDVELNKVDRDNQKICARRGKSISETRGKTAIVIDSKLVITVPFMATTATTFHRPRNGSISFVIHLGHLTEFNFAQRLASRLRRSGLNVVKFWPIMAGRDLIVSLSFPIGS
jgi:hypothetical protein